MTTTKLEYKTYSNNITFNLSKWTKDQYDEELLVSEVLSFDIERDSFLPTIEEIKKEIENKCFKKLASEIKKILKNNKK
jgi:hypothetical protein